ncbi:MAG: hypothetical protein ACTSR3_02200 [Candidatus Helarchaeota archaeon]
MACENCYGYIPICIVSGLIGIYLLRKYYLERNKFSLYMASFFVVDSIGWFIWFYTSLTGLSEIYLMNPLNPVLIAQNVPVIIAQIILLLFVLSVFDVNIAIRVLSVITVVSIAVISLINQELYLLINIAGIIVTTLNIILFFMNWQRNNDIKSLGFAFGLMLVAAGGLLAILIIYIEGIFLIAAATIWLITFSGLLERVLGEG